VKRGTGLERRLAIAGIGLWLVWAAINLWPPPDYLFLAIGLGIAILAITEFGRWQAGKSASPLGSRRGKKIYPSTAWFALGAVPAFVLGVFVSGLMTGPSQGDSDRLTIRIVGIAAWLVGGLVASSLLVRSAERRDRIAAARPPTPSPLSAIENLPLPDRERYEALLEKRAGAGLSDVEANELGQLMARVEAAG